MSGQLYWVSWHTLSHFLPFITQFVCLNSCVATCLLCCWLIASIWFLVMHWCKKFVQQLLHHPWGWVVCCLKDNIWHCEFLTKASLGLFISKTIVEFWNLNFLSRSQCNNKCLDVTKSTVGFSFISLPRDECLWVIYITMNFTLLSLFSFHLFKIPLCFRFSTNL